jgi:hypothetical protein
MSAHTFDSPIPSCPICRRTGAVKINTVVHGLLTCKHCQERLVVSWSGHYVRDPFSRHLNHQLSAARMLRRESHPIARMVRDFGIARHASMLAALSGLVFLSLILSFSGQATSQKGAPSPVNPTTELSE